MGKQVQKQAVELGFTKFPLTILYSRPRRLRPTFSMLVCDTADAIRNYIQMIDASSVVGRSGGTRSTTHYYLAPKARLYVEVIRKTVGVNANDPGNIINQINIFSKYRAHVISIAQRLNDIFPDGMLPHMDWMKIEKKFGVLREDCIAKWKALLAQVPREERSLPSPEEQARLESEREEIDKELEFLERDERSRSRRFRKTLDKYRD